MPILVQSLAEWEAAGEEGLLSVVIPAHNEEGHIAETVTGLREALDKAEIPNEVLVVNDNSSDRTEEILREMSEADPHVRYINNQPPNGFGFAVRAGLTQFKGAAVVIVMADGSDDPNNVVAFARKWQEGHDCVFGTRFARESRIVDYPWFKLVLNRLGNWFIQILFMTSYNDATNAFKLYGRHVIAGCQPLLSHHFNLTVEIPLKAMVRGYSFAVVPNNWYNRKEGVSKFKVNELASRYLFIILYCWLEGRLSRADYKTGKELRESQLQVWSR